LHGDNRSSSTVMLSLFSLLPIPLFQAYLLSGMNEVATACCGTLVRNANGAFHREHAVDRPQWGLTQQMQWLYKLQLQLYNKFEESKCPSKTHTSAQTKTPNSAPLQGGVRPASKPPINYCSTRQTTCSTSYTSLFGFPPAAILQHGACQHACWRATCRGSPLPSTRPPAVAAQHAY
jgi:hypothetical protein